jgi:hypothetical protein
MMVWKTSVRVNGYGQAIDGIIVAGGTIRITGQIDSWESEYASFPSR